MLHARRRSAARSPADGDRRAVDRDDAANRPGRRAAARRRSAAIVAREVDDPRIGFATITDVETTPDLRHAKVWVSVIGQPDERTATLARAGPGDAVRPARARAAAAPQAHPGAPRRARRHRRARHARPPAPRRARGRRDARPTTPPIGEIAADAGRRGCRHEGDAPTRPAGARRPHAAGRAAAPTRESTGAQARHASGRRGRRVDDVDLAPYLDAVPGRRRRADPRRAARARGRPREPRRRHARRDARRRRARRGAAAARPTRSAPTRSPPLYDFLPGIERVPDRPGPDGRLRPARRLRLRRARPGRRGRAAATRSCSSGCRGSSSTTTPRTTRPAPPTGSIPAAAATCEMVALLAARLGVPLDAGGRRARRRT